MYDIVSPADDVIKANQRAVRRDKHKHRLRRSINAIQSAIDNIERVEPMGLTYQSARFMQDLTNLHAFNGGNHRTAYAIANLFLLQNNIQVRVVQADFSYAFVRGIASLDIKEVQEWIEKYMIAP